MPPTDGFDELALMRCRGECGWSSSTATSASSLLRIGADRRSAMRSVSRARAWCLAAPTARRSTESAGARTCSSRSQVRARASSEAVRSSRSASSSRNRASRLPAAASKTPRRCAADVQRPSAAGGHKRGSSRRRLPTADLAVPGQADTLTPRPVSCCGRVTVQPPRRPAYDATSTKGTSSAHGLRRSRPTPCPCLLTNHPVESNAGAAATGRGWVPSHPFGRRLSPTDHTRSPASARRTVLAVFQHTALGLVSRQGMRPGRTMRCAQVKQAVALEDLFRGKAPRPSPREFVPTHQEATGAGQQELIQVPVRPAHGPVREVALPAANHAVDFAHHFRPRGLIARA